MDLLSAPQLPFDSQDNCELFEKLPGEVRDRIYTFALSYYDDPDQLYDRNTPYWRPDCLAPPKVDCALLQTCQRVYREAWFRPWASLVQKFWLTAPDRRPNSSTIPSQFVDSAFYKTLQRVFDSHGRVELNKVQVFPQLYNLEPGDRLSEILSLHHLYPLSFTITIRHHDWWFWESDNRLHINATWVNKCRFPDSLKTISLELESLQRKKDQIEWMAEMMRNTWHFQTKDGTLFSASKADVTTTTWTGSSTWNEERWVRDETQPEKVEYYIRTVTWKPDRDLDSIKSPAPDLTAPEDKFKVIQDSAPYLDIHALQLAGVPPGVDANEAKRLVLDWNLNGRDIGFGLFDSEYNEQHATAVANGEPTYNSFPAAMSESSDSEEEDLDEGEEDSDTESENQGQA